MSSTDRVHVSPFTLSAGPDTDLWRKPPSTNRTNAVYKTLGKTSLGNFDSAGVTFHASWKERYDQAGIALFFKQGSGPDKWIKSGVEFYNKKPYVSVVATDAWSDWSITPVAANPRQSDPPSSQEITIEARREGDEMGPSIWLYQLHLDENGNEVDRIPLRECSWVFAQEHGVQLEIAAYTCRPAKDTGSSETLDAHFSSAWWAQKKA
ncbi:MAG: hypothetical protein Q9160_008960 [Pyrenula sp. 1 TL-2023]